MKKSYSRPVFEFVMFSESDVIYTSSGCSTPENGYYEGVNTYAESDGCFDCTDCD